MLGHKDATASNLAAMGGRLMGTMISIIHGY